MAETIDKKPSERKVKSLYFEGRVVVATPSTESKLYAALAVLTGHGFRAEMGSSGVNGRFPGPSADLIKEAVTELAKELKAGGHTLRTYSVSEVWVDSGSYDTLKLLEEPPHADKR